VENDDNSNLESDMFKLRWPLIIGGISAALAVMMNALGAHALSGLLATTGYASLFNAALHMHEMHAIGLLVVGIAMSLKPINRLWVLAAALMLTGQLLFCGNLYLISLYGPSPVPLLTPVGGFCLITSWIAFAAGAFFNRT
jgi:uncharacterized membrane protein YgdD (TMEM256/DUF423 family)